MTSGKPQERLDLACAEVLIAERLSIRSPSPQTVRDYAQAMRAGAEFPPIDVAAIRGRYYLIDGRHRLEARGQAGEAMVTATAHRVTWERASAMAAVANTQHGRPLRGTEKAKALQAFLRDTANDSLSLQEVVDELGGIVSRSTVRNYRARMKGAGLRGSDAFTAGELAELAAEAVSDRLREAAERQLRGLGDVYSRMKEPQARHEVLTAARSLLAGMEAEGNASPGPLDI